MRQKSAMDSVQKRVGERSCGTAWLHELMSGAPDILFYISCVIWIAYAILGATPLQPGLEAAGITQGFVVHRVELLLVVSELVRIWRREYGLRDAVALVVCAVMSLCAWRCDWPDVICANLLVFCARNQPLRKLLAVSTATVAVVSMGMVLASLCGIVPDFVIEHAGGARIRHCLGFTYPLFPAMYLFVITCVACWLRGKRMRVWEAVLLVVANVAMLWLTKARLSGALATVCVVMTLAYARLDAARLRRLVEVASWAFVIAVVVTVVVTIAYALVGNTGVIGVINKALGQRVRRGYEGVVNMGVPLLGQNAPWVGNGLNAFGEGTQMQSGYNWVDNAFLHAAIQYGLVYTFGLVTLYTVAARQALRQGDALLVMVLAFLALHMLVDDLALQLHYNVLLFVVAAIRGSGALVGSGLREDRSKEE